MFIYNSFTCFLVTSVLETNVVPKMLTPTRDILLAHLLHAKY